tara:strand:- start:358 stop:543 length:186 start_codon:yes stop_codon:yes gene_type:complete
VEYEIGDLVLDPEMGVGLIFEIMLDDNDQDGLIYLVFYAKIGESVLEYASELVPYYPDYRD